MTICPHCKNEDWHEPGSSPLENLGGKENYEGFSLRRYYCHNCNAGFWTEEKWHADMRSEPPLTRRQKRALTLFDQQEA